MPVINIQILRKKANNPLTRIVCGNSDYKVSFAFDDEWDAYETKTARFIWNGQYVDVVFTGTVCDVPVVTDTSLLSVGVFAGDLRTSTPAMIGCDKSILCGTGAPAAPTEDVYAQIMELLNSGGGGAGSGGGVSSWNDLTDKPFYEETSTVEVLPEYKPAFIDNGMFPITEPFVLALGERYTVNLNGTEYKGTAIDGGKSGYPGTIALVNDGANLENGTGVVVAVVAYGENKDGGYGLGAYADGSTSVTISIYQETTVIHPIEGKFLPKGTPYVEENVLLAETNATGITHPTFGQMWAVYGGIPNLKAGETYTITYNGVDYKCVCQVAPSGLISDPNAVAMGNFAPVGGENTGEPFAMLVSYAYQEVDIIDLVSSTAVKVGITETEIEKLDPRCLPDTTLVNVDMTTMTADKTCGEIWEAMQNKQNVFLVIQSDYGLVYSPCAQCVPDAGAIFFVAAVSVTNGEISSINSMGTVCVKPDGSVLIN